MRITSIIIARAGETEKKNITITLCTPFYVLYGFLNFSRHSKYICFVFSSLSRSLALSLHPLCFSLIWRDFSSVRHTLIHFNLFILERENWIEEEKKNGAQTKDCSKWQRHLVQTMPILDLQWAELLIWPIESHFLRFELCDHFVARAAHNRYGWDMCGCAIIVFLCLDMRFKLIIVNYNT